MLSWYHHVLATATIALCIASSLQTAQAADGKNGPLQVYILAGQSNMQGHAQITTMDAMRLNPQAAPLLKDMRNADGTPYVCDHVWISSVGCADEEQIGKLTAGYGAATTKIGPEFTFGIYMEKKVTNPILIIKTSWGGKSIHTDFRPPGAGPFEFSDDQLEKYKKQNKDIEKIKAEKAAETGHYYRLMMEHVKKVLADPKRVYPEYNPDQGLQLAGFVWFQGWNDMVARDIYPNRDNPGGYDLYSTLLAQFIRDVRKDLDAPQLPFVIGVMGTGGPTEKYGPDKQRYKSVHQNFRDAMAAPASLPEFAGNVSTVLTEKYWDMEVSALRDRRDSLKVELEQITNAVKAKEISKDEGSKKSTALLASHFNEREIELLTTSTSNAEFHYLGSAIILGQIGKAFAEAMIDLQKKP